MKLSINQLKYLKSLHQRKNRQTYHNFIVEGTKIAAELLQDGRWEVEAIVAAEEWAHENRHLLGTAAQHLTVVPPSELERVSLLSTPNQVFMVVKQPVPSFDPEAAANGLSLYLEDIQDPGNLGTILRIADWFGIGWVFCSPNCVDAFNPKVVQASMGAFLRVRCLVMEFDRLRESLPQLPVYGTVLDGQSIFEQKPPSKAIIAIGNESKGLSPSTQAGLTHRIAIPKPESGGAESLNAAVATGIVCALFSVK